MVITIFSLSVEVKEEKYPLQCQSTRGDTRRKLVFKSAAVKNLRQTGNKVNRRAGPNKGTRQPQSLLHLQRETEAEMRREKQQMAMTRTTQIPAITLTDFQLPLSDFKLRDSVILEKYHHLLDIYRTLNEEAMSAVTSASLCLTLLSVCLLFVSAGEIEFLIDKIIPL